MRSNLSTGLKSTRQKGLTLVELMIAVTLGLIMAAVIAQTFVSSKQSYRVQDALSRIQENGRFSIDQMTRDIRAAGFRGSCLSVDDPATNTLNTAYSADFSNSIVGYEAGSSAWTPTLDSSISALTPAPAAGNDILTIRGGGASGIAITAPIMSDKSADLQVQPGNNLQQGQFVAVCDSIGAAIFQITNASPSSGSLVHDTGGAIMPGNSTKDLGKVFGLGSEVIRISTTTYYIAAAASGSGTSLWRAVDSNAPVELVEGVQGMQITYGVDTDADHNSNKFVTADSIIAADWAKVMSVRISLLLQSVENGLAPTIQPYNFNGSSVTPADYRLRRVFTTTVSLRNRLS